MTLLGTYRLTRYYTVLKGQKRYFNKNYKNDYTMNCSGDCFVTASGYRLKKEDAYKIAACPPNFKLGTKIYIPAIGELRCEDRGGAIKGMRLDIWSGVGDEGLDNLYNRPETSGYHKVYLVK